jgi:hypothetical protein
LEYRQLSPEIDWTIADPGLPQFFPSVHGGATVVFSIRRWPGELFTLWLPENLHAAGVHPVRVREGPWESDGSALAVHGESLANDGTTAGAYRAMINPIDYGLHLVVRMGNTGSRPWTDPWANICLKLAHAPSFDDPELARTSVRFGGQWTPLCRRSTLDHRNHYRIVLPRRQSPSMLEHLGSQNIMVAEAADHTMVATRDAGGGRWVGFYSPAAVVLVFNGSERVRCIHSNPAALPFDVPPGGEATTESYLLFLDGTLDSLIRIAEAKAWGNASGSQP